MLYPVFMDEEDAVLDDGVDHVSSFRWGARILYGLAAIFLLVSLVSFIWIAAWPWSFLLLLPALLAASVFSGLGAAMRQGSAAVAWLLVASLGMLLWNIVAAAVSCGAHAQGGIAGVVALFGLGVPFLVFARALLLALDHRALQTR